jgi:CHAT domain-containing protein
LAPSHDELPATRQEVQGIGRAFGADASVLLGRQASEAELYKRSPGHDILHLATRGVVNRTNPLFSYVELSSDSASDGRLEVHEVFGLELDASLVVLSACETALGSGLQGDVPAGDDWVGLVRAFLFAGASSVLATLWRVEDRSTAELMSHFYDAIRSGRSPSEALTMAQRALLRDPAHRPPFFWAGFTLSGKS